MRGSRDFVNELESCGGAGRLVDLFKGIPGGCREEDLPEDCLERLCLGVEGGVGNRVASLLATGSESLRSLLRPDCEATFVLECSEALSSTGVSGSFVWFRRLGCSSSSGSPSSLSSDSSVFRRLTRLAWLFSAFTSTQLGGTITIPDCEPNEPEAEVGETGEPAPEAKMRRRATGSDAIAAQ
jgi:hypothetical protein